MSYPGSDSDNEQEARSGHDQVWRSVRVTIHCQSRGFSQVNEKPKNMSFWYLHRLADATISAV